MTDCNFGVQHFLFFIRGFVSLNSLAIMMTEDDYMQWDEFQWILDSIGKKLPLSTRRFLRKLRLETYYPYPVSLVNFAELRCIDIS